MPTFTGKTFSNFYKNILGINQTTNTGVDSTTREVHDGAGNSTSISLSDDVFSVAPKNDDTTATFGVRAVSGGPILTVDTTNSVVKAGATQLNTLTYFQEFAVFDIDMNPGQHTPMFTSSFHYAGNEDLSKVTDFGTGSEPATTLDFSESSQKEQLVATYWYVPYNIQIDEVRYLLHCSNSSAITTAFWLFWYTLDASSNPGDLSGGTKLASSTGLEPMNEKILSGTLSLEGTTTVDAGKIVLAFIEEVDTTANEHSAKLIVKYHVL